MTPDEKRKSLPAASAYRKLGITVQVRDESASQCSDNDAALRLNPARAELFQLINQSHTHAA